MNKSYNGTKDHLLVKIYLIILKIKEVSKELNNLDSELITNYINLDLTFQEYKEIVSTLRQKKGN